MQHVNPVGPTVLCFRTFLQDFPRHLLRVFSLLPRLRYNYIKKTAKAYKLNSSLIFPAVITDLIGCEPTSQNLSSFDSIISREVALKRKE